MSQSVTAPRVTFEELANEKAALSDEEKSHYQSRMQGWQAIMRETPTHIDNATREMNQALEKIDKKDDYLKALELCPEVVQTESPPLFFLRCCEFDPLAAAERLVAYWKYRREIFEEDEAAAFRPMSQQGGTLSVEDVVDLRRGAVRLLGKDLHGRSVIYIRRAGVRDIKRMIRCFLYLLSVICRSSNSQRHGFVVIDDTKNMSLQQYNRRTTLMFVRHMFKSCQIRFQCMHLIYHNERSFGVWNAPVVLGLIPRDMRQVVCTHMHIRPEAFVTALGPFALTKSLLPSDIGGFAEVETFYSYLDEVENRERETPVAATGTTPIPGR